MTKEVEIKPLHKPGDRVKETSEKPNEIENAEPEKKVEKKTVKSKFEKLKFSKMDKSSATKNDVEKVNDKDTKSGNKVSDFFKHYWKVLTTVVVIVALVVIIVFLFARNTQAHLNTTLESMGRDWYENFYWQNVGSDDKSRTDFLSRYKDIGIKVDLDNLGRYNSDVNSSKVAEFHPDSDNGCDSKKTMVTIKPQDPYGKSDYKIETTLSCK